MSEQKKDGLNANLDDDFLSIDFDSTSLDDDPLKNAQLGDKSLDDDFDNLFKDTSNSPITNNPDDSDDDFDDLFGDISSASASDSADGKNIDSLESFIDSLDDTPLSASPEPLSESLKTQYPQATNINTPKAETTPQTTATETPKAETTPQKTDESGADPVDMIAAAVPLATSKAKETPTTQSPSLADSETKTESQPSKNKSNKSLFKKSTTKKTKTSKQKSSNSLLNDSKKLNMLILGGIIALVLIVIALYMTLSGGDTNTPIEQPEATTTQVPNNDTQVSTPDEAPQTDDTQDTANDTIIPETTKPLVNPDEILSAEIPNDDALVKEEIDRLADTNSQLAEQSKLIEEQLDMIEDLTTAKAEQIALLEAQIAELEKQKSAANEAETQPAEATQTK